MVDIVVPFIFQTWSNFTLYYISPECQLLYAEAIIISQFCLDSSQIERKKKTLILFLAWRNLNNIAVKFLLLWQVHQGKSMKKLLFLFIIFCRAEWGCVEHLLFIIALDMSSWVNICICFPKVHKFNEHYMQIKKCENKILHFILSYSKGKQCVLTFKIPFF